MAERFRGYREGDLDLIEAAPQFREERDCPPPDDVGSRLPLTAGTCFTLTLEGRALAAGGAIRRDDGIYDLWGYAGRLTPRQWARVRRQMRLVMELLFAAQAFHATVRIGHHEAFAFLARLGFEPLGDPWEGWPGGPTYQTLTHRRP